MCSRSCSFAVDDIVLALVVDAGASVVGGSIVNACCYGCGGGAREKHTAGRSPHEPRSTRTATLLLFLFHVIITITTMTVVTTRTTTTIRNNNNANTNNHNKNNKNDNNNNNNHQQQHHNSSVVSKQTATSRTTELIPVFAK